MSTSGVAAIVLGSVLCLSGLAAAQQQGKKKKDPPPSKAPVKDLMERTHKEKGALIFKVRDEESTPEEVKMLLEEYKAMAAMKPPTGDAAGWKNRTSAAISALTDLSEKKSGAIDRVRSTTACTGCHNAHRVGGNAK